MRRDLAALHLQHTSPVKLVDAMPLKEWAAEVEVHGELQDDRRLASKRRERWIALGKVQLEWHGALALYSEGSRFLGGSDLGFRQGTELSQL